MSTLTDTIVAATAKTILTGRATIAKVTVQSATPGVFSFYDSVGNIITWSRPTYTKRQLTGGQTAVVAQPACSGAQVANITRTGQTETTVTVAAAPTAALPKLASIPEGCCCCEGELFVKHGLTVVGTVAATVIVEYYT